MIGKVEKYLIEKIHEEGAIHITLIDLCSPKEITNQLAAQVAIEAESYGTAAIMVGGSSFVYTPLLDAVIQAVKKKVKIPVIIFPNNVTGISRHADAIWFMSLLNSSDPYFITGAQVLGAPIIKEFGLETIPLGYIVIGTGGSVGVIGRVSTIPYNKPEIAVAHALAAQYFGMRFVYLEAGSGAEQRVPNEMIQKVKKVIDVPLIVGGGIRTGKQAKEIVSAGANIVVTSTTTENLKSKNKVKELIENIKIKEDKK